MKVPRPVNGPGYISLLQRKLDFTLAKVFDIQGEPDLAGRRSRFQKHQQMAVQGGTFRAQEGETSQTLPLSMRISTGTPSAWRLTCLSSSMKRRPC